MGISQDSNHGDSSPVSISKDSLEDSKYINTPMVTISDTPALLPVGNDMSQASNHGDSATIYRTDFV